METSKKLESIKEILDDMKAEQIEVLDVHAKTSIADYFIICSATSNIHMRSIIDKVEDKLKEQKIRPLRLDVTGNEWGLLDYGDILLHVMKEEARQFYDLEGLWNSLQSRQDLL